MKYYNYEFIIYPDSIIYDCPTLLEQLKSDCSFAYIIHDKDRDPNGSLKKAHIHFLAFFKSQHSISAISNKYNFPSNDIQIIKNKSAAIQYLIHYNDDSKYQYEYSDIVSNFNTQNYFIDKESSSKQVIENQSISVIIDYIDSSDFIDFSTFIHYILDNKLYSYYRRSAFVINKYIDYHNSTII